MSFHVYLEALWNDRCGVDSLCFSLLVGAGVFGNKRFDVIVVSRRSAWS